jgi:TonB-linked SusC/RagA family outer membrane protein
MKKLYSQGCRKIRLIFWVLIFLLIFVQVANAQNNRYTITGRVTESPSGGGIPGVVVKVQNTNFAVATNGDGRFSLSADLAPGSYQVVFSSIGYKSQTKTVQLGTSTQVTVNGEITADNIGLDEVIVTGTSQGTTRKQMGSYVTSVKGDALVKAPSGNVLSALQGKAPGAQISQNSGDPAGGMSVRLRGVSSVNSGSDPLYIIDGVIVNNTTSRVTNTSANYDGGGSGVGGNGNFVGAIGQNRMSDINPNDIERIEVLNGAAAAAIYGSRANAGVIQIFTKRGTTGKPVVSFSTSLTVSELRKQIEFNQSPVKFGPSVDLFTQDVIQTAVQPPATVATLYTSTTPVTRYNYQDYIFQTAVGTDNTVSVAGGSEDTKFYTSLGYFSNQGIIKNTDYKRYNMRANLDQKITNWAKLSAGFNYIHSDANEKPDGNSFFSPMNSVTIIGNFHDLFTRDILGNLKAVGERGRVNPVSVIEDIKQRQAVNRVVANAKLVLNPVKNLTVDYTIGVDNTVQNGTTFIPPFAYNVSTGFYGGGLTLDPTLNGYASSATATATMFNHELNFTYDAKLSDDLLSTTQLGGSYQYEKNNYLLSNGRGLAPFVESVNGASTILPGNDDRLQKAISGAYLQQNFKYKDHLFATGAVRVDQSTVFGENNRTKVYLKGNISYVLSSAEYWKGLNVSEWWDTFKVRAAYGQSGNLTGIAPYERFNEYIPSSFLGKTSLVSKTQLANINVEPERQSELEIGTDLSFFKSRLGLVFNWYTKKVDELLIPVVIAPTTGYVSLLQNNGTLKNKGFEIMLTGTPVATADFKWNTSIIFNRNRNKVEGIGALQLISTNAGAPVAIIDGQPIGVFYGTYFARNADGSIRANAQGILQQELSPLRKVIGDPNPDYTGSFVNDFSYKKLSLHIQLDASQGADVWNADWRTRQGVGSGKVAEQEQMGLLPRGYVSGVYGIEEWRIDDGSYVKLREVSLSYNVGKIKFIQDLTVNLSGRNLISWDNYKGYDPELNSGGQSTILRNIDFGSVPIPMSFSLGVQAKF